MGYPIRRKGIPEYFAYNSMKYRCYNSKSEDYHNYGGRGITVCRRWRLSYTKFLEDMGKRPSPQHSLERIDNDKGYTPKNCKWATAWEQSNNRRSTVKILHEGNYLNLLEFSKAVCVLPSTLRYRRYRYGCSWEEAVHRDVYKIKRKFKGQRRTLEEWADHCGMSRQTLSSRLFKGWSWERALTEEVRPKKKTKRKGV
jgi:hypothetical protein